MQTYAPRFVTIDQSDRPLYALNTEKAIVESTISGNAWPCERGYCLNAATAILAGAVRGSLAVCDKHIH